METEILAGEMLDEVEATRLRSEHFIGYWRSGAYVQIWGAVWFVGYLGSFFYPQHMYKIFLVCDTFGLLGSLLVTWRLRDQFRGGGRKIGCALLIILVFGVMTSSLIGNQPEAEAVFWTWLIMTAYMVLGLWAGLRWIVLGATVCVLSLLSYWYLMSWFNLAMAIVGGGGLILGGTWMRRAA